MGVSSLNSGRDFRGPFFLIAPPIAAAGTERQAVVPKALS